MSPASTPLSTSSSSETALLALEQPCGNGGRRDRPFAVFMLIRHASLFFLFFCVVVVVVRSKGRGWEGGRMRHTRK